MELTPIAAAPGAQAILAGHDNVLPIHLEDDQGTPLSIESAEVTVGGDMLQETTVTVADNVATVTIPSADADRLAARRGRVLGVRIDIGAGKVFEVQVEVYGEPGKAPATAGHYLLPVLTVVMSSAAGVEVAVEWGLTPARSVYQTWLDIGNEGTEEDFIAALKGDDGEVSDEQLGDVADGLATGRFGPPAGEPRQPNPDTLDPSFKEPGDLVAWMSADGTKLFRRGGSLGVSTDGGSIYTTIHTFARTVTAVRELGNGELLVALINDSTTPGEIFVSDDYVGQGNSTTWTKVLEGNSPGAYFQNAWQFSIHENLVFVAEYGNKVPPGNARKAYVSDNHATAGSWREIFDGGEHPGLHTHGIAYDPDWDRVWVIVGDRTGTKDGVEWSHNAIRYSDDWREEAPTWRYAMGEDGQSQKAFVSSIALERCILLGSDGTPDGVHRIRKLPGRRISEVEPAHIIDNGAEDGNPRHIGGLFYRRSPDDPVLLPFSLIPDTSEQPGILIATLDGFVFHEIWRDTQAYLSGGLSTAFGPDASGNIVGTVNRVTERATITAAIPRWVTAHEQDTEAHPDIREVLGDHERRQQRMLAFFGIRPYVFGDAFNRADSASSLGVSSSGKAWTADSGTWGVQAGAAYTTATSALRHASAPVGLADGVVEVEMVLPSSILGFWAGVQVRHGGGEVLRARVRGDTGQFDLRRNFTEIATANAVAGLFVIGGANRMRVEFEGRDIVVFLNDVLVLEHELSTANHEAIVGTGAGLHTDANASGVALFHWITARSL